MSVLRLVSDFEPKGDQPEAIRSLVAGLKERRKHQVLLGVTGSGKSSTMAAIVNQINATNHTSSAYSGFSPAGGTASVSLPLIMDRNFGYFTGIAVANVGSSATNINCTFTGTDYVVSQNNVAPGAALTDVQLNKIANGYVGSATCTASGGDAKIAAIVNELASGAPTDDKLLTYNGANY